MTARRPRATAAFVGALVAATLVGCTDDGSTSSGSNPPRRARSGALTVADAPPDAIRAPYVVTDRLYGMAPGRRVQRLGGVVHAPFFGTLAPAAVPDAAGRRIAYHAFRRGRPVITVHDTATGDEELVDTGAYSVAWRDDGLMAYFEGLEPRVRDPESYRGHVVVRRSLSAPPRRWTSEPARYVVAAWSGPRLLVHRVRRGWPDVLLFDGPRRARVLARRAALVALSPDGARALVTREPSPSPVVAVLDVASGDEIATLDLAGAGGDPPQFVADSGSWTGDVAVAGTDRGLVVFHVTDDGVAVEQHLRVDPDVFPIGFAQPRVDASGRLVALVAEIAPRPRAAVGTNVVLECDRVTLRCRRGPHATVPHSPHVVYNPSR